MAFKDPLGSSNYFKAGLGFVCSDHVALMDAADGVDARSPTAVAPKLCDFLQSGSRVGDLDPVRIKKKAYNRQI